MRLIDADAFLESLGEGPISWTDTPEEIQAVDDWREFVSMINDAPTVCEWINVKDRLPEIGKLALVYGSCGAMTVARHVTGNEWGVSGIFSRVTHWMPLPEPPKEVDENGV